MTNAAVTDSIDDVLAAIKQYRSMPGTTCMTTDAGNTDADVVTIYDITVSAADANYATVDVAAVGDSTVSGSAGAHSATDADVATVANINCTVYDTYGMQCFNNISVHFVKFTNEMLL